jgi:hypothetical protein
MTSETAEQPVAADGAKSPPLMPGVRLLKKDRDMRK